MRLLLVLALLFACKKSPPRFCDQDLSGIWLNASDRHYAYRLTDERGKVRGEFLVRAEDGGLSNPADKVTFDLVRGDGGIDGVMRMTGETASSKLCPQVDYSFRITSCQSAAFQATVETQVVIGEDCQRLPPGDRGLRLAEYRFEREHPSDARDAGAAR